MNTEYNVLHEFLKSNRYKVDENQLELEYLSHPDKPDLVSYCETLDVLGIEHIAAELTKDNLDQIDNPFIVHLQVNGNQQFCLVRSVQAAVVRLYDGKKEFAVEREQFLELWDGIVLCIDPFIGRKYYLGTVLTPLLILVLAGLIFTVENPGIWQVVYYLLAVSGALISLIIVKKELGLKNKFSEKFCGVEADAGCNKIIGKPNTGLWGLSIGDISLSYFTAIAWLTLLFPWTALYLTLCITGILSVLIILCSISYQRFVARTWCRLCLLISMILLLQIGASLATFGPPIALNASFIYLGLLFAGSLIAIFKLKPFIKKAIDLKETEIENLTFRKNYKLFDAYIGRERAINCSLPDHCLEITIGSPSARVELIAISNPMCGPCAKAHSVYEELLEMYPQDIRLKIRFYVPFEDRTDPRTQVAAHFLELIKGGIDVGTIQLLLNKWYKGAITKNELGLKEVPDEESMDSLRLQKHWCTINGINQTPTLIINGKKFPAFYRISDLRYYMETCINSGPVNSEEYISSYNI